MLGGRVSWNYLYIFVQFCFVPKSALKPKSKNRICFLEKVFSMGASNSQGIFSWKDMWQSSHHPISTWSPCCWTREWILNSLKKPVLPQLVEAELSLLSSPVCLTLGPNEEFFLPSLSLMSLGGLRARQGTWLDTVKLRARAESRSSTKRAQEGSWEVSSHSPL